MERRDDKIMKKH